MPFFIPRSPATSAADAPAAHRARRGTMPLSGLPASPLSRARLEANRPSRDRLSFHAARKVRRRVAESAAPSGSGGSSRRTLVRESVAFSRSRLDDELPFSPVVHSAVPICRLWCVSLPCLHLDTNVMPKRGSTTARQIWLRMRYWETVCPSCREGVPIDGNLTGDERRGQSLVLGVAIGTRKKSGASPLS